MSKAIESPVSGKWATLRNKFFLNWKRNRNRHPAPKAKRKHRNSDENNKKRKEAIKTTKIYNTLFELHDLHGK